MPDERSKTEVAPGKPKCKCAEGDCYSLGPICGCPCHDALSVAPGEAQREPDPMQVRRALWLGHGHTGMYGDDGEMQCSKCPVWDYRRAPFLQIVSQAWALLLENAQAAHAAVPSEVAPSREQKLEDALREIVARIERLNPRSRLGSENIISDIARAALEGK